MTKLNSKIPKGPLAEKWSTYKDTQNLVNPANKRRIDIIVVGSGLAGAAAAASLGEMGFVVKCFTYHDSPVGRTAFPHRAASMQRRITATTATASTGCFTTQSKGRFTVPAKATCTAWPKSATTSSTSAWRQGVPFAREYGGLLDNRSFGGALCRAPSMPAARRGSSSSWGPTVRSARRSRKGSVQMYTRRDMMDLVIVDGRARGIIVRNNITGEIERHSAHAVVLATGVTANVFFLSTTP